MLQMKSSSARIKFLSLSCIHNMKKIIYVLAVAFLFSCKSNDEQKQILIGNWHGTAWLINNQPSGNDAAGVHFSFMEDDTYNSTLGIAKAAGTYKVKGGKLYTTEEGKEEIVVGINKLTVDSLVFDMNRGGQPEMLFLLRD